jgi:NTE family protein
MAEPGDLPELQAFLADIPFFASLDEASRLDLARALEPVHMPAGEVVFRQGDPGDGLYLVVSGRLRVTVAAEGGERMLHDLGRGAVVGEIALLTDRPRSASVHAVRDTDLQLLRAPVFQALAERSPALMSGMMRLLADPAAHQGTAADRPRAARGPGHSRCRRWP